MNEAERKFKAKGTVSRKLTIPMLIWEEWEKDCRDNFNNTYHLKMQFDHEFRHTFNMVANLLMADIVTLQDKVMELVMKVEELENRPAEEPKSQKSKTFGGN